MSTKKKHRIGASESSAEESEHDIGQHGGATSGNSPPNEPVGEYEIDEKQTNVTNLYNCPFPIYKDDEGVRFRNLSTFNVTQTRMIDWVLLRKIGIEDRVRTYFANLGLLQFAEMKLATYEPLVFEFLSTAYVYNGNKVLVCRLRGRECIISRKLMKDIFGFPMAKVATKPNDYAKSQAREDWLEISGDPNFSLKGVSVCLFKDVALRVVQKFLAYNIFGKEQANKMNQQDLFILRALDGKRICATDFIWDNISTMVTKKRYHPSFGMLATAFALHFRILKEDHLMSQQRTLLCYIDWSELCRAQFINRKGEIIQHANRLKVRNFFSGLGAEEAVGAEQSQHETDNEQQQRVPEDDLEDSEAVQELLALSSTTAPEFSSSESWGERIYNRLTNFEDYVRDQFGNLIARVDTLEARVEALHVSRGFTQSDQQFPPADP